VTGQTAFEFGVAPDLFNFKFTNSVIINEEIIESEIKAFGVK